MCESKVSCMSHMQSIQVPLIDPRILECKVILANLPSFLLYLALLLSLTVVTACFPKSHIMQFMQDTHGLIHKKIIGPKPQIYAYTLNFIWGLNSLLDSSRSGAGQWQQSIFKETVPVILGQVEAMGNWRQMQILLNVLQNLCLAY